MTASACSATRVTRWPPRLLANGKTLVGRSFKYHRPRGFLSAGVEEPNGLFTVGEGARTQSPMCPAQ
jgi:NADPH-dependent 2,4-dienoyl-CoA reductase/sulfur reductase-like enzyme